ncbi:MAG: CoA-binding protein [Prosthecobacter sp.]|jgi:predicted CoA-binding protein|uniref:CoA-binding protein n=1 Tax=Prosthecobacter sp. TaxID=1965333 RepID=UPI0019FA0C9E|nr:CoA-binding protein [Prosthecobacter sp.]MBE2283738.1 CoA-binding protein [Prosthecobacter sp.]
MKTERVAIVGASDNPERYSHKALLLLRRHGHEVVPVHPKLTEIEGAPVVPDLSAITGQVDTVTMYVGPAISAGLQEKLTLLRPRRVIFNPGAENAALETALTKAGIVCEEACTLVLLNTGQF